MLGNIKLLGVWLLGVHATALASPPITVAPDLPGVEDFLGPEDFWAPVLSPTGRYLAGIRRDGDQHSVVIADLEQDELKFHAHAVANYKVSWVEWASEDRLLVAATYTPFTLSIESVELPLFTDNVLIAMDADGGDVLRLDQAEKLRKYDFQLGRVTDLLPADSAHILLPARRSSSNLDLFKVNLNTGERQRIAKGSRTTIKWLTDVEGQPALRVDSNARGSVLHFYAREVREAGRVKWRKAFSLRKNRADLHDDYAMRFRPLFPGPTAGTFYAAAREADEDRISIHLYDFENDRFIRQLGSHKKFDVLGGIFNRRTRELEGIYYHDHLLVMELHDQALQKHTEGLARHFEGLNVYPMQVSGDRDKWLLRVDGPTDAGRYFVYDTTIRDVTLVAVAKKSLHGRSLAATEIVNYRARDGLELTGYLTTPVGVEPTELAPLVVLPHGGPEVRDHITFDPLVQLLAAYGYQVFQPNFRGSAGFGREFARLGHRQWGRAMQTDIEDGVDFLIEQERANEARLCIAGGSYGGYAALAADALAPTRYRCAISDSGPSDLVAMLDHTRRAEGPKSVGYEYWKRQIGDPKKERAQIAAVSPNHLVTNIDIPILLIHGVDDRVVPYSQSERMERRLRKSGKTVRLVPLPGTTHFERKPEQVRRGHLAILEFLAEHLPTSRNRKDAL